MEAIKRFAREYLTGDLGFGIIALISIALMQVLNVESADVTMHHFLGTIVVGIYPSTLEVQVIVATMRRLDYFTALALLAHAYAISFVVDPPTYLLNATIGSKVADVLLVVLGYYLIKKFAPNMNEIVAFFIVSTLALINDAFFFGIIGVSEGCKCLAPFWGDIGVRMLMQACTASLFWLFYSTKKGRDNKTNEPSIAELVERVKKEVENL